MAITFFASGQKILGSFEECQVEDKTIYLKEIIGNQSYLLDSANIDAQGKFEFDTRKYQLGYYSLGFENNDIQIILNPSEEELKLIFGNKKLKEKVQIVSSEENMLLWNFKYKSRAIQFETASLNQLIAKQLEKEDSIKLIINGLSVQKQNFKDSLLIDCPDSFFSKTIKSSQHISFENKEEVKLHYFDGIDFSDESLVRSNVFPSKIMKYLQVHTPYDESGFKASIDFILEKSQANEMVYNLNLNFLLSLFDEIGPDLVFDYLINEYVLNGGCTNETVASQWKEKVATYENLLIGKTAPNIQLDTNLLLSQVVKNSKYTILFFWSSQCHFCHDQLPALKAVYSEYDEIIEIIGYSLDTEASQWKNSISDNDLEWKNFSDLKGWESLAVKDFKINRTPSYYLLDNKRTIIAKPINSDELVLSLKKLLEN